MLSNPVSNREAANESRPSAPTPAPHPEHRNHQRHPTSLVDRGIRQLRVCVRVLSAVLLALIARSIIDGANLAVVLSEALIALLLLASGALWRYGRLIETRARAHAAGKPKSL